MSYRTAVPSHVLSKADSNVKTAALLAIMLGAMILFGVGFAQPAEIHNAAHDTRHALNFPCH
ncbi:MAG: CbtB domain-containing protein [Rhodospirillales bacterium]|nr:CbtB domain-containing protein [Rhodospirillales bacterium]